MANSDYPFMARLLHRLALSSAAAIETAFDLECRLNSKYPQPVIQAPVFVTGLARAGTTVIMRALHSSGQFRSLTYRDMPFVTMPRLWQKISANHRQTAARSERAHGDGVMVDFDSPEALDEVFWRGFCGEAYIQPDHLCPHQVDGEIIAKFRTFVANVLLSESEPKRYLAKNNNSVLRLEALTEAFADAVILVPFRDPLQQAISLHHQHKKFVQVQQDDRFAGAYMGWLAHHEFGGTHRPFRFDSPYDLHHHPWQADEINHWLQIWLATYHHILEMTTRHLPSHFVGYEKLCSEPESQTARLAELAKLPADGLKGADPFRLSPAKTIDGVDEKLLAQCQVVYQAMQDRC
uniref:Sulfotransferase n=1 Tax=Magnetococcus massalia (strain MO-1) TaxID=451514 RepID=A0A1S7LJP9_MAGMO|nr:conserved protein of unknown function [Candidatus Magnetococcus massalia]